MFQSDHQETGVWLGMRLVVRFHGHHVVPLPEKPSYRDITDAIEATFGVPSSQAVLRKGTRAIRCQKSLRRSQLYDLATVDLNLRLLGGTQRRKSEKRRRRGICISCPTERAYEWYPLKLDEAGSARFVVTLPNETRRLIETDILNPSAKELCEHCLRECVVTDIREIDDSNLSTREKLEAVVMGTLQQLEERLEVYTAEQAEHMVRVHEIAAEMVEQAEEHAQHERLEAEKEYQHEKSNLRARLLSEVQESLKHKDVEGEDNDTASVGTRITRKMRNKRMHGTEGDGEEVRQPKLSVPSIMQLSDRHVQEDLHAIQRMAQRTSRPSSKGPTDGDSSVVVHGQTLTIDGYDIEVGASVVLQGSESPQKFRATVLAITLYEVVLKKPDGVKSRIPLSQLRNGRWVISES